MKMLEISGDRPRAEKLPAAELSVSARDFRPIMFTCSLYICDIVLALDKDRN